MKSKIFFPIISSFLLISTPAVAQINNSITIETNTGGNTITNQEGAQLETGDSQVSIKVNNQSQTSQTSTSNTKSETKINVSTTGGGQNLVEVGVNKESYKLIQTNGETKLITTDETGNIQEKNIGENEIHDFEFTNGTIIKVKNSPSGLEIYSNQTKVVTQVPVEIDVQNQKIIATANDEQIEITKLPNEFENQLSNQPNLTNYDQIELIQMSDGALAYQTSAQQRLKFLGIIPVNLVVKITSSTQSESELEIAYASAWNQFLARFGR